MSPPLCFNGIGVVSDLEQWGIIAAERTSSAAMEFDDQRVYGCMPESFGCGYEAPHKVSAVGVVAVFPGDLLFICLEKFSEFLL